MKLQDLIESIQLDDLLSIVGRNLEHVDLHFREALIDQLEEMADHYEVDTWQEALPHLINENLSNWLPKYRQMQKGSFFVYRTLKVPLKDGKPDIEKLNTKNFGIHWSTEMHTSSQSFGYNPDLKGNWDWVPFYAKINSSQVHWPNTIAANFSPDGQGDEEQEVVLKNGQIDVLGYYRGDVDGNWKKVPMKIVASM